jgi:hypothetical protein
MNHIFAFLNEYQSVLVTIILTLTFSYIRYVSRSIARKIDLMRIKIDSMVYANQKVNGIYKEYTDEWIRHFNEKYEMLMKEYNFTFKN